MNKDRRKEIEKLITQVDTLISETENVRDDEQSAYDNVPENLQDGEKATKMYDAIENLENAISSFEEVKDYFQTILEES